jgi:hypothetical protein
MIAPIPTLHLLILLDSFYPYCILETPEGSTHGHDLKTIEFDVATNDKIRDSAIMHLLSIKSHGKSSNSGGEKRAFEGVSYRVPETKTMLRL